MSEADQRKLEREKRRLEREKEDKQQAEEAEKRKQERQQRRDQRTKQQELDSAKEIEKEKLEKEAIQKKKDEELALKKKKEEEERIRIANMPKSLLKSPERTAYPEFASNDTAPTTRPRRVSWGSMEQLLFEMQSGSGTSDDDSARRVPSGTINKPASPTPQQQSLKSSTDETSPPTSPPTSPKVANLRQRFEKPGLKGYLLKPVPIGQSPPTNPPSLSLLKSTPSTAQSKIPTSVVLRSSTMSPPPVSSELETTNSLPQGTSIVRGFNVTTVSVSRTNSHPTVVEAPKPNNNYNNNGHFSLSQSTGSISSRPPTSPSSPPPQQQQPLSVNNKTFTTTTLASKQIPNNNSGSALNVGSPPANSTNPILASAMANSLRAFSPPPAIMSERGDKDKDTLASPTPRISPTRTHVTTTTNNNNSTKLTQSGRHHTRTRSYDDQQIANMVGGNSGAKNNSSNSLEKGGRKNSDGLDAIPSFHNTRDHFQQKIAQNPNQPAPQPSFGTNNTFSLSSQPQQQQQPQQSLNCTSCTKEISALQTKVTKLEGKVLELEETLQKAIAVIKLMDPQKGKLLR